jgi:putative NADH-flavin reductase
MKVLVLVATGGTGRLIVCDALAKSHSVVALVRSKARALDFPGSRHDRGRARDEGALIRALEVSSATDGAAAR